MADTTNRDGLQSLSWWNYWTAEERAILTKKLSDFGMHHIELGFPAIEKDPEYNAVKLAADSM
jgi:isopropylmalate/homocitrate/citramalate synthase